MWGRGDRGLDGAPGWRQARSPLTLRVYLSFPPLSLFPLPLSFSSLGLNGSSSICSLGSGCSWA